MKKNIFLTLFFIATALDIVHDARAAEVMENAGSSGGIAPDIRDTVLGAGAATAGAAFALQGPYKRFASTVRNYASQKGQDIANYLSNPNLIARPISNMLPGDLYENATNVSNVLRGGAVSGAAVGLGAGALALHYYHQWPLREMQCLKQAFDVYADGNNPATFKKLQGIKNSVDFWYNVMILANILTDDEIQQLKTSNTAGVWNMLEKVMRESDVHKISALLDTAITRLELMHGIQKYSPYGLARKAKETVMDLPDASRKIGESLSSGYESLKSGASTASQAATNAAQRAWEATRSGAGSLWRAMPKVPTLYEKNESKTEEK